MGLETREILFIALLVPFVVAFFTMVGFVVHRLRRRARIQQYRLASGSLPIREKKRERALATPVDIIYRDERETKVDKRATYLHPQSATLVPMPAPSPTTPGSGQEVVVGTGHIIPQRIELGLPPVRDV